MAEETAKTEKTEKAARNNAGPMTTMICKEGAQTEKGERTFVVLKKFDAPPADKDLKATLKELGEGDYTVLTYRSRKASYKTVTAEKFDL